MPDGVSQQRAVRLDQLLRPLGRNGKGLQQRADRAADEDASGANRSPGWPKQRTTSPRLPGGTIAGPQVTKAFCGAVAAASELINLDAESPAAAAATVIVAGDPDRSSSSASPGGARWTSTPAPAPRLGQILRAARQFYGRHWRVLLPVALAALVLIGGDQPAGRADHRIGAAQGRAPASTSPGPTCSNSSSARSPRRWSRRSRSSSPAKRCATARSASVQALRGVTANASGGWSAPSCWRRSACCCWR